MIVLVARLTVMSGPQMTLGRRRWPVVLVASVVLVSFAACSNRGDSVAVLGDSITELGRGSLEQELGSTYSLSISGRSGHTVEQMLGEAGRLADEADYDQVIINLGSNDVLQALPTEPSMAALEQMVAMFPEARCIHLVDINEHMVIASTGESRAEPAIGFNSALESFAAESRRRSIVNWNEVASGHLNDEQPPWSTLTVDSIHPSHEGNDALNSLYSRALQGCSPI